MHVEIHTERILSKFAELSHHMRDRIYRIWLVSPWITYGTSRRDPLVNLVIAAQAKHPKITVITRPPEDSPENHLSGLKWLLSHSDATAYTLPSLHSKIYLLHCDGFRAAFFGSANFTVSGNERNQEIAIDLRSTIQGNKEKVSALINELNDYVSSLRNEATLFIKDGD
jgi:hypothetical protein